MDHPLTEALGDVEPVPDELERLVVGDRPFGVAGRRRSRRCRWCCAPSDCRGPPSSSRHWTSGAWRSLVLRSPPVDDRSADRTRLLAVRCVGAASCPGCRASTARWSRYAGRLPRGEVARAVAIRCPARPSGATARRRPPAERSGRPTPATRWRRSWGHQAGAGQRGHDAVDQRRAFVVQRPVEPAPGRELPGETSASESREVARRHDAHDAGEVVSTSTSRLPRRNRGRPRAPRRRGVLVLSEPLQEAAEVPHRLGEAEHVVRPGTRWRRTAGRAASRRCGGRAAAAPAGRR